MINGFFGGKFMPLHKGHLYCIDVAAAQCDRVVVIMFINGDEELEILKTHHEPELKVENRIHLITGGQLLAFAKKLKRQRKNHISTYLKG